MPLWQWQEIQEVLRTVGGQPVELELTQIDYRSGMLIDNKTPNNLPVATWRMVPIISLGRSLSMSGDCARDLDNRFSLPSSGAGR